MGWKGTLRSMNAASRRTRLAAERRSRAVSQIQSRATTTLAALSREIEKEIDRIEKYEEKVSTQPSKTLGLEHDAQTGWTTTPFKEQTGKLTYTVKYTPPSITDAVFEPQAVDIGGVQISPRALSVSQYFTAIAFDATASADGGGRILKLTFPKNPESSRIALASPTGDVFTPLDTNLDGRLFAGTKRTGVVAFEPFSEGTDYFEIFLEASVTKKSASPDTIRIRVTAPTLRSDIAKCLEQPSILEQMTQKFRATENEFKTEVTNAATAATKQASRGCLVVVAASLGIFALALAFVF